MLFRGGENLWILAVLAIGGLDTRGEMNRIDPS